MAYQFGERVQITARGLHTGKLASVVGPTIEAMTSGWRLEVDGEGPLFFTAGQFGPVPPRDAVAEGAVAVLRDVLSSGTMPVTPQELRTTLNVLHVLAHTRADLRRLLDVRVALPEDEAAGDAERDPIYGELREIKAAAQKLYEALDALDANTPPRPARR